MSQTNREIVEAVNEAFRSGHLEDFYALCAPDVRWWMNGKLQAENLDAVCAMMAEYVP